MSEEDHTLFKEQICEAMVAHVKGEHDKAMMLMVRAFPGYSQYGNF
jgi:hypothetical protein